MEVQAEIAPRSEQRRWKQKRRQKEKKNQFRVEAYFGQSGNPAEQQSADDEQDGVGDVQLAGEQREHGHRQQQTHKDFNDSVHAGEHYR